MSDWNAANAAKLAFLHPVFADRVRALLAQLLSEGIPVLITQGTRTWAEQDALYAKGRTAPGEIVTNAKGGSSQHNYGLAVDLCPFTDNSATKLDWNVAHPFWKRMLELAPLFKLSEGAHWRTFPDNPHFFPQELPDTCTVLRAQFQIGGMDGVWKWFGTLAKGA